jgi:hypothetical protein
MAAAQVSYVPGAGSRVWIEGTSTVNNFTCATRQIHGQAQLALQPHGPLAVLNRLRGEERAPDSSAAVRQAAVEARIPVRTLDCGKTRQNRDLYAAMQGDAHPHIRYELRAAEVAATPDSTRGHYVLRTTGALTIAGVTRTVQTRLRGQRLPDGRVQARGSLQLQMTAFGIEPPSALMGLIQVHDEIVVHFDLTGEPASP